jgi:hypothetical protein
MKALSLLSFILLFFTSCEDIFSEEEETNPEDGAIYLQVIQDLEAPANNQPGWCNIISGCYSDNHPDTPVGLQFGSTYGPLVSGEYSASYCFDQSNPASGNFTYTFVLSRPPAGYKRIYTKLIRDYNEPLNRCVAVSMEAYSYSYQDIPI